MMRRITIVLTFLLALVGTAPAWAGAPFPRARVVVDDPVLRLGDVFENLEQGGDSVIGDAPRPGVQFVRDAAWLAAVARAHSLPWQPTRDERVVIERASRLLTREEIDALLRPALAKRHVAVNSAIDLDGHTREIYVARSEKSPLKLVDFQLDARGRFTARLANAPEADDAGPVEPITIAGRVSPTESVPVPTHRINPGEVIVESDIQWLPLRTEMLRQNALTDMDQIVGMAARQPLDPGQPIHAYQVQVPIVVAKGETVSIKLEAPNLAIATQGRALESGGEGAVIRVLNTQSKRTIEAKVLGPSMVGVSVTCCTVHN